MMKLKTSRARNAARKKMFPFIEFPQFLIRFLLSPIHRPKAGVSASVVEVKTYLRIEIRMFPSQ